MIIRNLKEKLEASREKEKNLTEKIFTLDSQNLVAIIAYYYHFLKHIFYQCRSLSLLRRISIFKLRG